jgi:hypothetical protein
MEKTVLGLDLDDLLFETFDAIIVWHNAHFGTNHSNKDMVSYHLCDLWGTTPTEANRRVYEFYYSSDHATMRLLPGVACVIPMLEATHEIQIFSARPQAVLGPTQDLVARHFPNLADRVHLTNRFGVGPEIAKSELCVRFKVEQYADDASHHHADVAKVVKDPILLETPWNRDYAATLPPRQRARSWYGIGILLA